MRAAPALLALVALVAASAPAPAIPLGLPVVLQPATPTLEERAYPILALDGKPTGAARWRVVEGTGNCCEHYLAATVEGRLLDFGGSFLHLSDDAGRTWTRVEPLTPVLVGEGAVAVAPDGDILGLGWDAYTGDHLVAVRWDAATQEWGALEAPLHTPFFDRPWLVVAPLAGGPAIPLAQGYVAVAEGGWPMRDLTWASYDGLLYAQPSSILAGGDLLDPVVAWLDQPATRGGDATAPPVRSGLMPLPGGGALTAGTDWGLVHPCTWSALRDDLQWPCFELPGGPLPRGALRIDARGWAHQVEIVEDGFVYRLSRDGGRAWAEQAFALPAGHEVATWDVQVRAQPDVAVVAVHALDDPNDVHRDLLYVLRGLGAGAPALTLYQVGDGDQLFGNAFGINNAPRFDFMSVAILPDGRIAASFGDAAHPEPGLAILLEPSGG